MARLFLLNWLLEEAYRLDRSTSRRQAQKIRALRLFNRDKDYVDVYRLSEDLVLKLEEDINPSLKKPQRRHRGLSTRVKLLCTFSFLASGSYQRFVGRNISAFLSQPSASRCIHEVIEALNHPSIVRKYLKFPQNAEERLAVKEKFFEKYHIPGVIGCVDGTFVRIVRPTENEERFYCRKGHATNVMLVDAETILAEESIKKPCLRHPRGECPFGFMCRFSHYTAEQLAFIKEQVKLKNNETIVTQHPSFGDLYQKLQTERSEKNKNPEEGTTISYDGNGVTHILPWVYNNDLENLGINLPPSVRRFNLDELIDANLAEWG